MKKRIMIILAILLAFILVVTSYFFVYGGEPEIENFNDVSANYETIANVAMKYYNELTDKDDRITLLTYDDHMKVSNYKNPLEDRVVVNLSEEEKSAIKTIDKEFDYMWVTKDYVIFWQDETKYYGLVYSEKPLTIIREMKNDWYDAVEYHRINSNWYEIGSFGR